MISCKNIVNEKSCSFNTSYKKSEKLLNYLEQEWSLKIKEDFVVKLDKAIDLIRQFPESGPKSMMVKNLRMHVITEQTSIFYRFNSKRLSSKLDMI